MVMVVVGVGGSGGQVFPTPQDGPIDVMNVQATAQLPLVSFCPLYSTHVHHGRPAVIEHHVGTRSVALLTGGGLQCNVLFNAVPVTSISMPPVFVLYGTSVALLPRVLGAIPLEDNYNHAARSPR